MIGAAARTRSPPPETLGRNLGLNRSGGGGGSEGQHTLLHRVSLSSHCRRDHFGPHPKDPAVLPAAAGHAEAAEAKAGIALRASSKGQPGVRDSRCAGYVSHITNLYKTLKDFSNCVTHLPD